MTSKAYLSLDSVPICCPFFKQQRIKKLQRLGCHLSQNPQHFIIKPAKLISVFPPGNIFVDFTKY